MSFSVLYSTLEEHIESGRSLKSPPLQQCGPNFDSLDTPPPLVDAPNSYSPSLLPGESRGKNRSRSQASLYDTLLVEALGSGYSLSIADRAGRELVVGPVDLLHNTNASSSRSMIGAAVSQDSLQHRQSRQQELIALRRASDKLNDALDSQYQFPSPDTDYHGQYSPGHMQTEYHIQERARKRHFSVSVASVASDDNPDGLSVSRLKIHSSPIDRNFEVTPPFRPTLPSLNISNSPLSRPHRGQDSISDSPALADSILTPHTADPSQTLPRLQNLLPIPHPHQSPEPKQSLPSLETALRELKHANGGYHNDESTRAPRLSPIPQSSQTVETLLQNRRPAASLSPPRFSSNPAAWRTLSQNSSNSNSSDQASGQSSHSSCTPAPRQSSPQSMSTPQTHYQVSEHDSNHEFELSTHNSDLSQPFDPNTQVMPGQQGYVCSFPSCTAAPFQTQYLLNSHQNVHSNQRPHFCPVDGCPRGPGGQGFKRKNEMIRHGLVHQSPGYVCPFCPDQQHKYPRPDNLQRHVRVHHVERERDDPLLREVLAQRPEGGNRGRRRRLGG